MLRDLYGIPSLRHLLTSEYIQRSHDRGFLYETVMPDMPDPFAILSSLDRQTGFLITLELGSFRKFIIGGQDGRRICHCTAYAAS